MTDDYKEHLRVDEDHSDVDLVYITPKIVVTSNSNDVSRVNELLLQKHPSSTYTIYDFTDKQTGICMLTFVVLYFVFTYLYIAMIYITPHYPHTRIHCRSFLVYDNLLPHQFDCI